jgi:hypothetical protein
MQYNELRTFIKQNAPWVYEYINREVLKELGQMSPNYFVKLINDILKKQIPSQNIDINILPYYLFTQIQGKGKMDYTSFRRETIDLYPLMKKAGVYHNYVRFSLQKDCLHIDLMQTKIGGMPIDEDIVKFTQKVAIKPSGLESFIKERKDIFDGSDEFKAIKEELEIVMLNQNQQES